MVATTDEQKTHMCQIPQERFDFPGYTFGKCNLRKDGHAYIGTRPSKRSIKRMVASISEVTDRWFNWRLARTAFHGRKHECLFESRMRQSRMSGSMRRCGNGTAARVIGHRQTREAATDKPELMSARHA